MNFNNVLSLESDKSINYVLRETQTQNIWGIGKQCLIFCQSIMLTMHFNSKN